MAKTGDTKEEVTDSYEGLYCMNLGIVSLVVCAPEDWDAEKVEREAKKMAGPTGIDSDWTITPDDDIPDSDHNGVTCPDSPGRKHWILNC